MRKKYKGDEYLNMKELKKSPTRRKMEKAGVAAVVSVSAALSSIVLGYTVTKFYGVRGKNSKAS